MCRPRPLDSTLVTGLRHPDHSVMMSSRVLCMFSPRVKECVCDLLCTDENACMKGFWQRSDSSRRTEQEDWSSIIIGFFFCSLSQDCMRWAGQLFIFWLKFLSSLSNHWAYLWGLNNYSTPWVKRDEEKRWQTAPESILGVDYRRLFVWFKERQ